ncbi:DNA alkylation repair protein [Gracilibacillus dipsosauri]|uniref:DNA alkylation repair protein n=1 Tax=Gracilibacillus dipsosauri TaxID=178340 RepID=A0A317KWT7_9BACI|nr:DNA alkylation repair protein [Gracilibacillus dipsosauri]PWU66948.1 hypothetical protein DLJ74_18985 [Gracilibacillus dipsosauri]
MGEYVSLKYYFGTELAIRLAKLIEPHDTNFEATAFIKTVSSLVENKELKQRVEVITDALREFLPENYEDSLSILLQCLGPENEKEEGMFKEGYFLMPVAFFVEKYGLDHFDLSMNALHEITKRHTSEYAIRPFLAKNTEKSIAYLKLWSVDTNPHVRRLVSEGTRPRLPWAKRIGWIKGEVEQNLQLLEPLMNDSSRYVRKSVANHLNDLTKESADDVLLWIENHMEQKAFHPQILTHGLRSLRKLGNGKALEIEERIK